MYLSDEPITEFGDDKLDRAKFVRRLAQTILDWQTTESLVIGIYGPWGSGKSSVLNLLARHLTAEEQGTAGDNRRKYVVVRFDPWFFNSTDQLLHTFFAALEQAVQPLLENPKAGLKDTFEKYAAKLSFSVNPEFSIGLFKFALPLAGSKPDDDTPERIRAQLIEMLQDVDGRVIVMIDNLDRLDPSELMLMFKLVRLCSDFPKFIYLLAFDRRQVIDLLKRLETDADFLEKIIQVDINLPAVDQAQIDDFVGEGIEQIAQSHDMNLNREVMDRFGSMYRNHIRLLVSDLRTAKRYLNACAFTLPLVKGEINYADFLALEAVRVFFPTVYYELPKYEFELTSLDLLSLVAGDQGQKDRYRIFHQFREWMQAELSDALEIEALDGILGLIFPMLGAYISNPNNPKAPTSIRALSLETEQRIASPTHFGRYFKLSVPSTDIPTTVVTQLINGLNDTGRGDSPEWSVDALRAFKSSGRLLRLFGKLLLYFSELNSRGMAELLRSISQISGKLNWQKESLWKSEVRLASELVTRCLSDAENSSEANDQLVEIIRNTSDLSFVAMVAREAISIDTRAPLFEGEDRESIVCELTKRINGDLLSKQVDVFESYPDSFYWILETWRDTDYINQPKETKEYVYERLAESAQAVGRLLSSYVSVYVGTGDPSALSYSKLVETYDAGILYELISKHEAKAQWSAVEQFAVSEFKRLYHESTPQ